MSRSSTLMWNAGRRYGISIRFMLVGRVLHLHFCPRTHARGLLTERKIHFSNKVLYAFREQWIRFPCRIDQYSGGRWRPASSGSSTNFMLTSNLHFFLSDFRQSKEEKDHTCILTSAKLLAIELSLRAVICVFDHFLIHAQASEPWPTRMGAMERSNEFISLSGFCLIDIVRPRLETQFSWNFKVRSTGHKVRGHWLIVPKVKIPRRIQRWKPVRPTRCDAAPGR